MRKCRELLSLALACIQHIAVGQEQISSVQGPKQWNSMAPTVSTSPTITRHENQPKTVGLCMKCSIFRNNNSISCCAPGGSWFNQCGTTGDPNFKHSYADGVCACKDVGHACKQQDTTMKPNAAPAITPRTTTLITTASLPAFGKRDPHVCIACTPPSIKSQVDSCPSGYFCCPFQRLCLPWRTTDCLCSGHTSAGSVESNDERVRLKRKNCGGQLCAYCQGDGRYQVMASGQCQSASEYIASTEACHSAALALGVPEENARVETGSWPSAPRGCFYNRQSSQFCYNQQGLVASSDPDRLAICDRAHLADAGLVCNENQTPTPRGELLFVVDAITRERCADICSETTGCNAISWDPDHGNTPGCELRSDFTEWVAKWDDNGSGNNTVFCYAPEACGNRDLVVDWAGGVHDTAHARFGRQTSIRAQYYKDREVVLADPLNACSPLKNNDAANKVVLVRRGECAFVTKAMNVQRVGGLAALLYDQIPGRPVSSYITMVGSSDGLDILTLLIDNQDGMEVKHEVELSRKLHTHTRISLHCHGPRSPSFCEASQGMPDLYGDPSSPVPRLNATAFQHTVRAEDDTTWLVEYYAEWCPHCLHYEKTFEKLAKDIEDWKSNVRVGAVSCVCNPELCKTITGFPTLKVFPADRKHSPSYFGKKLSRSQDIMAIMRSYISGSTTTVTTTVTNIVTNIADVLDTTPSTPSLLASLPRLNPAPIVGAGAVVVVVVVVAVAAGVWWFMRVKRMAKRSAHGDELSTPGADTTDTSLLQTDTVSDGERVDLTTTEITL